MTPASPPEVWLRGPIPDVPALLQPVAHALLQAVEDVELSTSTLPPADIWASVGGAASIGFHLRHMTGSLDRLLTYARGEALTDLQRDALGREQACTPDVAATELVAQLRAAVDAAIRQLRATDPSKLTDARAVGRAGLPSTVLGLLFHAGEHTTRHAGQIITTARIQSGLR